MSGPNDKKYETEETWTAEFERSYSHVGVQVSMLTSTGSWHVIDDDDADDDERSEK